MKTGSAGSDKSDLLWTGQTKGFFLSYWLCFPLFIFYIFYGLFTSWMCEVKPRTGLVCSCKHNEISGKWIERSWIQEAPALKGTGKRIRNTPLGVFFRATHSSKSWNTLCTYCTVTVTLGQGLPQPRMFHISLRTLQCDPFRGSFRFLPPPPPPHQLTVRVTQQLRVGQFQMVCQFKEEIDKSAPPPTVPWFYSHFRSPTKNLTDRICGVSTLQIFEPFSHCRNAYTGKLNERGGLCQLTILYTFFPSKKISFS